jgi:hypothetical protein
VIDHGEGIDNVAHRFGHLFAAVEQKAVRIDPFRRRDPGGDQEGLPVDRVKADDVFVDDVKIGRPEAP